MYHYHPIRSYLILLIIVASISNDTATRAALSSLGAETFSSSLAGLFVNNTIKLSEKYNMEKYKMEVTPADWTFLLSALIYLWQGVWLAYGLSMFCRKTTEGPLYLVFPVLPPILYIVYSFSLACNVAWLLIWDKEYMEVALIFINLMTCTLYICLVVSIRRVNEFGHLMIRHKLMRDIWAMRVIVQNGLGLYAAWGTVASVFNFAIVLTFGTGLSGDRQAVGSTVSLIIFTLEIFAWFIFDNFVFEKPLRYLFTPYSVIVISLVGILSKNWDPTKRNAIYTAALLGMVILMSILKMILTTWRHYKKPIFSNKPQNYRRPIVSFEVRNLLEQ